MDIPLSGNRQMTARESVCLPHRRRSNRPGISQAEGPRSQSVLWKEDEALFEVSARRRGKPCAPAWGESSQASVTEGVGRTDSGRVCHGDNMSSDAKLPLDTWHRAQGARMVGFAGYEMPIQFEGIMAEHLWTRESAGLFDVSHMGQLIVSGPDAAAALETVLPGEIQKLGTDRMRYSLLLMPNGGIVDDLMVTRLAYADPEYCGIAGDLRVWYLRT